MTLRAVLSFAVGTLFATVLAGQTIVIDAGGAGDVGFSAGTSTYTIPSTLFPTTILPPGTNDATMRYGSSFSYHVKVPNPGLYTISLYFCEPTYSAAGQRIMSVTANDTPLVTGLDLAGEAGFLVPTQRQGIVAVAGTDLYINFSANGGHSAVVSMILVQPTLAYLCDMRQSPAKNVFVSWIDPDPGVGAVFLAGLKPNVDYVCGSYNLATAPSYAVSMASCNAYVAPKPCLTSDIAATAWGVINQRCTRCHGNDVVPGDVSLVGNLDLRTVQSMLEGGNRGPALVPGDPAHSLIAEFTSLVPSNYAAMAGQLGAAFPPTVQDVANLDALDAQVFAQTGSFAVLMPPFYPLQPAEIEALENWILIGAPSPQ